MTKKGCYKDRQGAHTELAHRKASSTGPADGNSLIVLYTIHSRDQYIGTEGELPVFRKQ